MPHVHPENELVGDLIQVGDVLLELRVRSLKGISELDLHKLVELLRPLSTV